MDIRKVIQNAVLTTLLASMVAGCNAGPPHAEDQETPTTSQLGDLEAPMGKAGSTVAKSERVIRKILLASQLIATRAAIMPSTLSSCISDTEVAKNLSWSLSCQNRLTTGQADFFLDSGAVTKLELELATTGSQLGTIREVLAASEVTSTTETDGSKTLAFKLDWGLYLNSVSTASQICSASTTRVLVNVSSAGLNSIQTSRLNLSCFNRNIDREPLTAEVRNLTLGITRTTTDNVLVTTRAGSFSYLVTSSSGNLSGSVVLNTFGLQDSANSIALNWQCGGNALCFP